MIIKAMCGQVSKLYNDTDAVFGLLKMCRASSETAKSAKGADTKKQQSPEDRAAKAYDRLKSGHTVKMTYMGQAIYLKRE